MPSFWNIAFAIVVCLSVYLFYTARDVPTLPVSGGGLSLGKGGYDMQGVIAPVATGTILEVFSTALTMIPLLRRTLLNNNHLENIRTLASQVHYTPMYYPVHRASNEEWEIAKAQQESSVSLKSMTTTPLKHQFRTINDYANAYRSGTHTPTDVMKSSLRAVRDFENAGLNIFSSIIPENVLAQAAASDMRHKQGQPLSLFDGVPVAFKDMIDVGGHVICNGQHRSTCKSAHTDDPIVARFRAAGAIIFGVTVMTEGGVTPLGWSAHFQGPFSAYSPHHYSGGSSSGSAVAVATGIVPVAIGFDGGGSIRIPASMSGVHGLGATFSRIPFNNKTDTTMIKAGPLATSALDVGLAYELIADRLPGHFYSALYDGDARGPPPPHTAGFEDTQDLTGVRIGIFEEWFNDADPEVVAKCKEAVAVLVKKGATVVDISIPHLQWMSLSHGIKISTEFALGFDTVFHSNWDLLEPNTQITIGLGKTMTALEVISAEKLRAWTFHYVRDLYATHNLTVIANPTVGVKPPELSDEAKISGENNTPLTMKLLKYIFMGNFIGMPGYSVPVGYISEDVPPGQQKKSPLMLPVGFHMMANHWNEHHLLRLANALDMEYAEHRLRPPVFFVDALEKRTRLATWYKTETGGAVPVEQEVEDVDSF